MPTTPRFSLLFIAVLAMTPLASAQQHVPDERNRIQAIDIGATFTTERTKIVAGDCGCFWLQGGSAEANIHVFRDLSAAITLTGSHAGNVTPGVDVTQIALMAGPRYTFGTSRWTDRIFGSQRRTNLFAEALFGDVHAVDGIYPSSTGPKTSASALSMQLGGGFDVRRARNFGLRAIEVDYVRTSLPNGTTDSQHDLRIAIGLTTSTARALCCGTAAARCRSMRRAPLSSRPEIIPTMTWRTPHFPAIMLA
jgi:outer membrane immunogenic protein